MRSLLITILLCGLTACASSQLHELSPQQIQDSAMSGELDLISKRVIVIGSDGIRKTVKVTEQTENGFFAKSEGYLFTDIIAIESELAGSLKTAGTVATVSSVLLALFVLLDWSESN